MSLKRPTGSSYCRSTQPSSVEDAPPSRSGFRFGVFHHLGGPQGHEYSLLRAEDVRHAANGPYQGTGIRKFKLSGNVAGISKSFELGVKTPLRN